MAGNESSNAASVARCAGVGDDCATSKLEVAMFEDGSEASSVALTSLHAGVVICSGAAVTPSPSP